MNEPTLERFNAFLAGRQHVQLSTISPEGAPDISTAPYVRGDDGSFLIFISTLASHTANLQANPRAAIALVADEDEVDDIFARERATFHCAVAFPEADAAAPLLDRMEAELGEIMTLLRSLPDFRLAVLTPERGRYVIGFGKAFDVDTGDWSLHPVTGE